MSDTETPEGSENVQLEAGFEVAVLLDVDN